LPFGTDSETPGVAEACDLACRQPWRRLGAVAVPMQLQLLGTFALRAGPRVVLDESWKHARAKSLLKLVDLAKGSSGEGLAV